MTDSIRQHTLNEAKSLEGYWPIANREMAENGLFMARNGTYVIRHGPFSQYSNGYHVLTISIKDSSQRVLHFPVFGKQDNHGKYVFQLADNNTHATLETLIKYHQSRPLIGTLRTGGGDNNDKQCGCTPVAPLLICNCGIPRIHGSLPGGWTVHRSEDPQSNGYLYFVDQYGTSSWLLPADILDMCSNHHYKNFGILNEDLHKQYLYHKAYRRSVYMRRTYLNEMMPALATS